MIIRKIPDIVVISDEKRTEYDPIIIMVALNGNNESIHRKKPREKAHIINEVSDGRLSLHLFFISVQKRDNSNEAVHKSETQSYDSIPLLLVDSTCSLIGSLRGLISFTHCQQMYHTRFSIMMFRITQVMHMKKLGDIFLFVVQGSTLSH